MCVCAACRIRIITLCSLSTPISMQRPTFYRDALQDALQDPDVLRLFAACRIIDDPVPPRNLAATNDRVGSWVRSQQQSIQRQSVQSSASRSVISLSTDSSSLSDTGSDISVTTRPLTTVARQSPVQISPVERDALATNARTHSKAVTPLNCAVY